MAGVMFKMFSIVMPEDEIPLFINELIALCEKHAGDAYTLQYEIKP